MTALLGRALPGNLINALQIALAALFQILLARQFGASLLTDAYVVGLLFVNFASTVAAALAEMFTQHYHEIDADSPEEAARFYQAVLNLTLAAGVAASVATIGLAEPLGRVLAPGFTAERLDALRSLISVLALGLVGNAAIRVNSTLLRAEMHFLPSYFLGLLTPALNVMAILICGARYGIAAIAAASVGSTMIGLAVQQSYIRRTLGIRWSPVFWHPGLGGVIRNSLLLRLGHQIWDFKDLVATSVLSVLPGGAVTLYFYGARIVAMVFAMTNFAWTEILLSMASRLVVTRDLSALRDLLRRNLIVVTGVFVVAVTLVSAALPALLDALVGLRLSAAERRTVYGVFLALIPFYVIVSLESSWVTLAIVRKQALRVALIGAAFIAIFWTISLWLRPMLGMYAVPVALALAQLNNLAWYFASGRRLLRAGGSPVYS